MTFTMIQPLKLVWKERRERDWKECKRTQTGEEISSSFSPPDTQSDLSIEVEADSEPVLSFLESFFSVRQPLSIPVCLLLLFPNRITFPVGFNVFSMLCLLCSLSLLSLACVLLLLMSRKRRKSKSSLSERKRTGVVVVLL